MNIFVIFFKNWQNVIGSKRRFRISTSLYKRQKKDNKLLSILTCSHHVFLILSKELPLSLWCSLILLHPHTLSLSLSLSLLLPLSHTQQKLNDKKCFSWIKMKFVLKLHFILFVATHFLSCDCYDSANRPGWSREVPWSPAYGPPPT